MSPRLKLVGRLALGGLALALLLTAATPAGLWLGTGLLGRLSEGAGWRIAVADHEGSLLSGFSLLGVTAVVAQSYERIHRSNLIGMGVLPLQFPPGESADSLGLTGEETFSITGIAALNDGATPRTVRVEATHPSRDPVAFDAVVRIDTPGEADYYRNGGIMPFVLRQLLGASR